ncbi:MAG: Hsp70 family protein, partial [Defluviitaleaceae bacterium]|nr:Hsp70 family protein [Defluviitaleaceae bacterium]
MKNKDYILGIDIGHGQIKVSYFNEENKNAEIYDFSFGKGSPGIPAVAQKIKDELIFGDLAITIPGPIIKDISADEEIISALIDEILATISEREPNARVKHITFAISENTKLEPLKTAIEKLGIPENLVEFKTESDCILNFYLSKKSDIYKNILVLDYGTQALRISLFKKKEKRVYIKESSHFDKELGMRALEKNLNDTLSKIYEKHTNKILSMDDIYNIRAFTHENKNAIFKNMKGIKLHLNFSEPIEHILYTPLLFEPFMDKFEDFIKNFINLQSINASDIEEVILIGGGFNMPWPLNIIENILPDANIIISKKYEHLISLGAATIAKTNRLDLVQIEKPSINFDIG